MTCIVSDLVVDLQDFHLVTLALYFYSFSSNVLTRFLLHAISLTMALCTSKDVTISDLRFLCNRH